MKIKTVKVNGRKKSIEIETAKEKLCLPFNRLALKPTEENYIHEIYVDPELGKLGVTYSLKSGKQASVHLDAFLDYNRDPDFLKNLALHKLTIDALKAIKSAGLSKHEITRRLKTSPSQLYRLLDPKNSKKSVDEMLRLLAVLGCDVEWNVSFSDVA